MEFQHTCGRRYTWVTRQSAAQLWCYGNFCAESKRISACHPVGFIVSLGLFFMTGLSLCAGLGGAVSLKKHSLLGNSLHCQAHLSRPNLRTLAKWCGQTPVNAPRRPPLCRDNSHRLPPKHPHVRPRHHLTLNNNPNLPTTTSSPLVYSLPTVWMIFATVDRE